MPGIILRCLEHMELKELGKPVAFLAKTIRHPPLAAQLVKKGLLEPNRWRKLLDSSCPIEVTLDALMIVSDLARMHKVTFASPFISKKNLCNQFQITTDTRILYFLY